MPVPLDARDDLPRKPAISSRRTGAVSTITCRRRRHKSTASGPGRRKVSCVRRGIRCLLFKHLFLVALIFLGESEWRAGNWPQHRRIVGGIVEKFAINVMKSLNETCPNKVVIVNSPDVADYFLRLDRDGPFILSAKMVVFSRSGEMSFVEATHSISEGHQAILRELAVKNFRPLKAGYLGRLTGFEPVTSRITIWRYYQLSYSRRRS